VLVVHPSAELYGSDRVAVETVAGLRQAGHQVLVVLAGHGPLERLMAEQGVPVRVLPGAVLRKSLLSPRGLLGFLAALARSVGPAVRVLREQRPDAVYVSTVTVPLWLLLARLGGCRVVCHVHEAEEALPRPLRLLLGAPLLLAHRVVANSGVSRDLVVRDLPPLARRTRLVDNGVPGPPRTAPARTGTARAVPAAPVRLVLVGRVSPRKGTDVAVEALALLRAQGVQASLTLVGGVFPGYEWFEQQVRSRAAELGIDDRVTWAGVLPDVWAALEAADIALVPSRVEPFGNAAVEAQLAGRPVVVGAAQGLREIVTAGVDGELATPGDPAALAAAVRRVLADWPGAVARAAAARDRAAVRFAPERYRREIVEVVVGRPAPAGAGSVREVERQP
jgi:glycosyltransferase involved in cell wall biosynthesis